MIAPRPIGLGCMRLSTEPDRDDERSIAVLHAALDAGATLLDTADAYGWTDDDRGHNERLIARALASWRGDRSSVTVATKGGMVRPAGRWEPDGRARHLYAACEASCRALGVGRLRLYQLHVPDPRTPLSTSIRALKTLQRRGMIGGIGLCNVTVGQIEEARRIADIQSVQVELSVWNDDHALSGVADYCASNGLMLLAHRPLGGRRARARNAVDPVLAEIAERYAVTPFDVALAWLVDLSDIIVPLPGATRTETARSAVHAQRLVLTDDDRRQLDERFPAGRPFRPQVTQRLAPARRDAEVVIVMGLPGAGKSTYAGTMAAEGYQRMNRDEAGGRLRDVVATLDRSLADGATRIVLDNTYVSRKSRAEVIRTAGRHGVPVRCVWLSTPVEDAQVNAAWRLVSRYGRNLSEDELAAIRKKDPAAFLPTVQFRYQRELEPPDAGEGFSRIDVVPFERRIDAVCVNQALIVWCDGTILRSRSGEREPIDAADVAVPERAGAILRRYQDEGWRVLGMSWQPGIETGTRSMAAVREVFARMNELLDVQMEVECCPHGAGPPRCWCRKPLPGLGVLFVHRHRLDPARCLYVGSGTVDPAFARRLGFAYRDAATFFA